MRAIVFLWLFIGGQSWKSIPGGERDKVKRYSDKIFVCDLRLVFDEMTDWKKHEKRENKKMEECVWTECITRLPQACNLMGVVVVKRFQIHVFGGFNGSEHLHQHLIYDARDLLKHRKEVEPIDEVMEAPIEE